MYQELRIKLLSYDPSLLDKSVKRIIEIAKDSNCELKGPIPLPTKTEKFTICRSVHVNKPSMEQFERRTHKRLIILSKTNPKTIESLKRLSIPSGVEIQIKL
ncbi:MAG: 30S ribosomal protein S10 [Candidatus Malacoplasma girerdii]|nr:MAG: 30S ribosomal protein S10 [Candidatus Malacoplasma girerdii]